MKRQPISRVRVRNFKAIRDSGVVRLTPLTVFIGNNGVGKSSLVEALETLQLIATTGLDAAMGKWHGIEHVRNKSGQTSFAFGEGDERRNKRLVGIEVRGNAEEGVFTVETEFGSIGRDDRLFFANELVRFGSNKRITREEGEMAFPLADPERIYKLLPHESLMGRVPGFGRIVGNWQFLALSPDQMGEPSAAPRTDAAVSLHRSGSNIATVLRQILELDTEVFNGLTQTLQYVLPYASDLQSQQTREVERQDFLRLVEGSFEVPGWMLSTGTLRLVALLAALRHPKPSSLLVIEELENGLDPRTLNLVMDEIREVVQAGQTQVIITTHSPYLLDMVPLKYIVTVEREDGQPVFTRHDKDEQLVEWKKKFSPGKLYTMGRLAGRRR